MSLDVPVELNNSAVSDDDYRKAMIADGKKADWFPAYIATESGHNLDCVGNLIGVYRTTWRQQHPSTWEIEQRHKAFVRNRTMDRARARARRNQVDPPMHEQVKVAIFIAVGIIVAALALLSVIGEVVVGMT